ncbi:hypothetical protein MAUB1S_04050 [Mycolicibacterium aubagnense]
METLITVPFAGTVCVPRRAATFDESSWSGSGPPTSPVHAAPTVGRYPSHALTVTTAHTSDVATAVKATARRFHRLRLQPATSKTAATAIAATQNHSFSGVTPEMTPAEFRYQRAQAADISPHPVAIGSHTRSQRQSCGSTARPSKTMPRASITTGIAP